MQHLKTPIPYVDEELTTTTERAAVFLDENYSKIVDEMFSFYDGQQMRRTEKFLVALRDTLVVTEYPTINDVWDTARLKYTESTKKQNERRIKHNGWLDGDVFGVRFWNEYQRRWFDNNVSKERLTTLKNECGMRHEYPVEHGYDYENTMDIINENPQVTYTLNGLKSSKLDYFDTHYIQIIKMNHVGGNPVVQLPLSFHYKCLKCGGEADVTYNIKSIPCDICNEGNMVRSPSRDKVRPAFASQVMTDDRNTISIISLTEIPPGEFIGAVFLCRNKADYYLFMIAAEEISPASGTIDIDHSCHAIWQIIDLIDNIHDEKLGKHINGMDWYKAAILFAYLDNRRGHTSTNILIVGGTGLAKTSTARLYIATITAQQKVQPVTDLTGPGLRGSTTNVKIGDTSMAVHEPGLLSRYYCVVLDELLGSNNPILPSLKTTMVSSTLQVEVAGNRSMVPKTATAIATSNRIPDVVREQGRWMLSWITAADEDPSNEFSIAAAQEAMEEEWRSREKDWMTGLSFADIERYSLIFFPYDTNEEISLNDIDGADEEIDDITLAKMLYNPNIDEYFNFRSKIVVDWKLDADKIVKFARSVVRPTELHSKHRFGNRITRMLILSAQINGRSELTDEDYDFVRELWSKTGTRLHINDLSRTASNLPTKTYAPPEWSTERIKKRLHDYLGFPPFSKRGEKMITDILVNEGADRGVVEFQLVKYREQPNQ